MKLTETKVVTGSLVTNGKSRTVITLDPEFKDNIIIEIFDGDADSDNYNRVILTFEEWDNLSKAVNLLRGNSNENPSS